MIESRKIQGPAIMPENADKPTKSKGAAIATPASWANWAELTKGVKWTRNEDECDHLKHHKCE